MIKKFAALDLIGFKKVRCAVILILNPVNPLILEIMVQTFF